MIKLVVGDCCTQLGETVGARTVDLVVTSPPYDNLRTYGGVSSWDFGIFKSVADELVRCLKSGGVIVWVVADATVDGNESGTSFAQALHFKTLGLRLFDTMIWKKDAGGRPHANRYPSQFEYMFVFSKGRPKTFNPICDRPNKMAGYARKSRRLVRNADGSMGIRPPCAPYPTHSRRTNVWENAAEKNSRFYSHPAVFPLALAEDHIKTWSNPGDLVLDPFAGSGTTLLAAESLGRSSIGIECNPAYVDIAKKRLGLK